MTCSFPRAKEACSPCLKDWIVIQLKVVQPVQVLFNLLVNNLYDTNGCWILRKGLDLTID